MNKAKQLALGQLFGLPADHTAMRDLLADPDVVALSQVAVIDKDDFLSAESGGTSLFSYVDVWEHMDTVVAYLREKGVDIKGTDFTAAVGGNKSPMSLADDRDMLGRLFTPVIWKGQYDAMRTAWYSLGFSNPHKDKIDFIAVQEQVAATEGKSSRVAQLRKMGIDTEDIRSAVSTGNYAKVNSKLAEHGDHFRREDVFVLDKWGDHTLDNVSGWNHFSELWDELAKNGERLEVEDLLFHVGERDSILKDAQDANDGVKELFRPRLWYGRAEDVVRLYDMLSESSKAKVKIDDVLEEIAGHEYSAWLESGRITGLGDITAPINGASRNKPGFHPLRPLGIKEVWNNIARVQTLLGVRGKAVTLADLRQTSGRNDETCLLHAARYGVFDKVMDIVHASGEKLGVDDLTAKDASGKSIVDYLTDNGQIDRVLDPRDWVGRGAELARLWQAVPEKARDKINFQQIIGDLNTIALRQRFAGRLPAPGM